MDILDIINEKDYVGASFVNHPTPILVKVKKLSPDAKVPQKATAGSSGFDLFSLENSILTACSTRVIRTGIAVAIPVGYEGQIRSRSGMAAKLSVNSLNSPGTIDSDYRGELKVILHNHSQYGYQIRAGDRIAQLVIQRVPDVIMELSEELDETVRGQGGLGSTGK